MKLLLVVGSSRSGTTMTARIVGRSPMVKTFEELHYVNEIVPCEKLDQELPPDEAKRAWALLDWRLKHGLFKRERRADATGDDQERSVVRDASRRETGAGLLLRFLTMHADKPTAKFVVEQTPVNLQYLSNFVSALPDVYALCPIRDPRDVLLSQKNRWRRRQLGGRGYSTFELVRNWVNYQPALLALMWRRDAILAKRYARDNQRFYCFRFEDLISAPESIVREICAFLDIPFERELLQVPMRGSSISHDEQEQTGIRETVAGRWKEGLSPGEVWLCERIAGDVMARYGYELSDARGSAGAAFLAVVSTMLRLPLMALANHRRLRGEIRNRVLKVQRHFNE